MLLGKPKDKFEVYNDLDDELVNLFHCVKDRPAELLLELGLLPVNSRTEFQEWLHFHNGGRDPEIYLPTQAEILDRLIPKEWAQELKNALQTRADYREVRQAAAYFKRVRCSYSSSGRSFACQPCNIKNFFGQIGEMSLRVEDVIIENQSFEVLIPHYDRGDSFFYLDPPYFNSEYVYDADFDWEQHVLLRDILASIKGIALEDSAADSFALAGFQRGSLCSSGSQGYGVSFRAVSGLHVDRADRLRLCAVSDFSLWRGWTLDRNVGGMDGSNRIFGTQTAFWKMAETGRKG